jgi:hypothetical protein
MDKKALLHHDIQAFIDENVGKDMVRLALSGNPFPDVDWHEILNQVAAKSKAKDKLPTWYKTTGIIYPPKISIEQASSEITAGYKAGLVSGKILDLAGGFGVDSYYFSQRAEAVVHGETNPELSGIARHNFQKLKVTNVRFFAGDGLETLRALGERFDWIYIDPSRRHDAKGKVFMLRDCSPDVASEMPEYLAHADRILVKTAPVLDLTAGLLAIQNVKAIHIVAVRNEVKELLWEIEKSYTGKVQVKTLNFAAGGEQHFEFCLDGSAQATFSLPKKYLFEPNAAVMKSGGFDVVSGFFHLDKLHPHTHLYTSDEIVSFPGRIFRIEGRLPYEKSALKAIGKANVTTRNFPDSVETIRKKHRISEGGDVYAFFTTDKNDAKIVLICSKI